MNSDKRMVRVAGVLFLVQLVIVLGATGAWANGAVETAQALFDGHRYQEARRALEPSVGSGSAPEARLLLARICNSLEDWECGLEHSAAAVKALPGSGGVQFEYALALRIKMSNVSKMKAMFSLGDYKRALARALELDPQNLDAHEEQIGYLINAPGFAGGDLEEARRRIADFEALDWKRGMLMRSELEDKEGNADEAGRILARVVERHPDDGATRVRFGFWHMGHEHWREAATQFAAVPEDAEPRHRHSALYQRGRVRVLGEFEAERAVAFFDQYVASFEGGLDLPSPSNAYWRQGMAYEQLGRSEAARNSYRQALRLDSGNKEAKQALKKLGG